MSEVQQLKTLIHEIAHAKLHNILKEKSTELARRTKRTIVQWRLKLKASPIPFVSDMGLTLPIILSDMLRVGAKIRNYRS